MTKVRFVVTTPVILGPVEKSEGLGLFRCFASDLDAVGAACKRVPSNDADAVSRTIQQLAEQFRNRAVSDGQ